MIKLGRDIEIHPKDILKVQLREVFDYTSTLLRAEYVVFVRVGASYGEIVVDKECEDNVKDLAVGRGTLKVKGEA